MIINPAGMEFNDWASAVNQQLGQQGDVVRVELNEEWREWAYRILLLPLISSQYAPRPSFFDDWREWANAFNQCVRY